MFFYMCHYSIVSSILTSGNLMKFMFTDNTMATSSTTTLSPGSIDEMLDIYIQTCEDLITQCQKLELKDGRKLEKKCRAELKYLLSVSIQGVH